MPVVDFHELITQRSVLVCVGCGGVGKTSVAASLGVAAARAGRRVLALTVDPAQRLAESLGVERGHGRRQPVASEVLSALGVESGTLSVMMLDPEESWNELIRKAAPTEEARARVLEHPLYQVLLRYLAGAHEYMAMEKLLTVLESGEQDLIVLDTPPSRHALDFLKAPERLIDAVDSPLMKALASAVEGGRRFSFHWISRGLLLVVRSLAKLMGAPLLEQLAGLIGALNAAFGGFRQRAERVSQAFRSGSFGYVLVTRAAPGAVSDTLYFERELAQQALRGDLIVANRLYPTPRAEWGLALRLLEGRVSSGLSETAHAVISEHEEERRVQDENLERLLRESTLGHARCVRLPTLPAGVSRLEDLGVLADHLVGVRQL